MTATEVQANGLLLRRAWGKGHLTLPQPLHRVKSVDMTCLFQLILTESSWPPFLAVALRQPTTLSDIMKIPGQ